jgi:hypothetical protein
VTARTATLYDMNNEHTPTAAEATETKGFVAKLLADRHSIPLSIALHLVRGALIVAVYAFAAAVVESAI